MLPICRSENTSQALQFSLRRVPTTGEVALGGIALLGWGMLSIIFDECNIGGMFNSDLIESEYKVGLNLYMG